MIYLHTQKCDLSHRIRRILLLFKKDPSQETTRKRSLHPYWVGPHFAKLHLTAHNLNYTA